MIYNFCYIGCWQSIVDLFGFTCRDGRVHWKCLLCHKVGESIVDLCFPFRGVEVSIMHIIFDAEDSTLSPFGRLEGFIANLIIYGKSQLLMF